MYKSVRAHKQFSKTIKPQSHNAAKHKLFWKKRFFTKPCQKLGLHLTPQVNIGYKCLGDPKNPI